MYYTILHSGMACGYGMDINAKAVHTSAQESLYDENEKSSNYNAEYAGQDCTRASLEAVVAKFCLVDTHSIFFHPSKCAEPRPSVIRQ